MYCPNQAFCDKRYNTETMWDNGVKDGPRDVELRKAVTNIIHRLGVRPNIRGYFYLREAIILNVKNPDIVVPVTKVTYPSIAKMYNTSAAGVESAIRHTIEVAWVEGNLKQNIFDHPVTSFKRKPKNSEFITVITDYLKEYG